MRIWIGGPRVLGLRTGFSFGPEDFLAAQASTAAPLSSDSLYVITADHGYVKVGVSADPVARLASLQTGSADILRLVYATPVRGDAYAVEAQAHAVLDRYRHHGEWFDVAPEVAVAAINAAAYRLGVAAGEALPSPPSWARRIAIASALLIPAFATGNVLLFIFGAMTISTWGGLVTLRRQSDWRDLVGWVGTFVVAGIIAAILGTIIGQSFVS